MASGEEGGNGELLFPRHSFVLKDEKVLGIGCTTI